MIDLLDLIQWAFLQNFYLDKSNACVHCAPVKFSPLTFRLFQGLSAVWPREDDITSEMAEVRSHLNKYELDGGR
jgi:hypothetical protein